MRVYDSQAYRKMDVTRERISRILELREILLSFQTGFKLVNAAVVCAILESISGLEPSSIITEPRYLKLVTVSSFCPFTLICKVNVNGETIPNARLTLHNVWAVCIFVFCLQNSKCSGPSDSLRQTCAAFLAVKFALEKN